MSFQAWQNTEMPTISYSVKTIRTIFSVLLNMKDKLVEGGQFKGMKMPVCHDIRETALRQAYEECQFGEVSHFTNGSTANRENLCTVMLVANLAEPAWLPVSCDEQLLSNIVCANKSQHKLNQSLSDMQKTVCTAAQIAYKRMCFSFWELGKECMQSTILFPWACSSACSKGLVAISNDYATKLFEILYLATNKRSMMIVDLHLLISRTPPNSFLFHSVGMVKKALIFPSTLNDGVLLSCSFASLAGTKKSSAFFRCLNIQHISSAYILDGVGDCEDHNISSRSSDEVPNIKLETCHSSPLFYFSKKRKCKSFVFITRRRTNNQMFKSKSIILPAQEYFQTPKFPCEINSSNMFTFSDICVYRVGLNKLLPCQDGSHVQQCTNFECNAKFKCPGFYCIPWNHVCNGKWDCPYGFDEASSLCPKERICKDMLKCRESYICISLLDVCNELNDCPQGDDELMCPLHRRECLEECFCVNLAIKCENITLSYGQLSKLPYVVYHIVSCMLQQTQTILQNDILILNLTRNRITQICINNNNGESIVGADISENNVKTLSKNCISNLAKLKFLSLKSNNISTVKSETFTNILSSFSLVLENNKINVLPQNTFENVEHVTVFNVKNNYFLSVETGIFSSISVDLVITDQLLICLLVPSQTMCNKCKPWYIFHPKIIQSVLLHILYFCLSVGIFIINMLLLLYALKDAKNKNKLEPFNLLLLSLCVTNLFICIYLATIGGGNQFYGELYFVSAAETWKTSFPCSFGFFSIMNFCLSDPILSILMAVSRFCVTKYPLHSKFKSSKFVAKWVVFLEMLSVSIAVGVTCLVTLGSKIPTPLCFPFADPLKVLSPTLFILAFLFTIQLCFLVSNGVLYIKMAAHIKHSGLESGTNRTLGTKSTIQLCLLCLFNSFGWLTPSIFFLVLVFLKQYPIGLLGWIIVIIPSDALSNPVVLLVVLVSTKETSGQLKQKK